MRRKISFFLGLLIGYLIGTQASLQQRARVSAMVDRLVQDPRVQRIRPGAGAPDPIRDVA